ncbi:hypothetical protein BC936DRAFT_144469 [Jimgerdemannia flammicorona]|uniref:Uncharacterized protein n=1 Tax=Jimgerdemannia flammicorona TaxID=994334 RepID=A0A433DCE2_9FUNG|nr:hypothetical protein BC936DRAFT_144469 [Jimgerdemannia flammicorona]
MLILTFTSINAYIKCLDAHYGEVESRSSRFRKASVASISTSSKVVILPQVRGDHALDPDLQWGREFGAAANVGASPGKLKKNVTDGIWLSVLLRDCHLALARVVLEARKKQQAAAINFLKKLLCSGLVLEMSTSIDHSPIH